MRLIIIAACLLSSLVVRAQKFSGGATLQVIAPQGEFKEVNNRTGIGGRINFHFRPATDFPVSIGADLGYAVIGSRTESFYTSAFGFYDEYRVTASNNIFSLLFSLRIDPMKPGALIRPYAEGLAGWNDFFSTVNVERITFNSGSGAANTNSSKARWSLAYGGSAGFGIRLDKRAKTFLDIKATYLTGRKTKYLTDPVISPNATVSFTEKESKTNMVIPQAGVRFVF